MKGVILISGRGSNMRSIVEAGTGLDVRAVISNRPNAPGLEWARDKGIATHGVDHEQYAGREDFDDALAAVIDPHAPDLILLAGFMRILSARFIGRYPRRILNIHPSLLPAFPGLHTHRQALAAGVKVHGATVHVVTNALDSGPAIVQGAVPVLAGDTEETLAARVLHMEHRIYPQAVRWFVEGKIEFVAGEVVQVRDTGVSDDALISPRNTE
ncbi:MAG: phosphoribosylglycinamide formyltransferase [Burkholderiales bacterium]|nr:phosphoribosylglycinamide formyltransferase [Burkholderiales bacterium]